MLCRLELIESRQRSPKSFELNDKILILCRGFSVLCALVSDAEKTQEELRRLLEPVFMPTVAF